MIQSVKITLTSSLLILSLWAVALPAHAGAINDLFSEGIFGLPWGATIGEVQGKFPNGRIKYIKTKYIKMTDYTSYTVKEGRQILGVDRSPSNTFEFSFGPSDKLDGVIIEFPASQIDKLMTQSQATFGEWEKTNPTVILKTMVWQWPMDAGIKVLMIVEMSGLKVKSAFLQVMADSLANPPDKKSLGLD